MDEKQVLKEAKKTIDNINAAQETLDMYLKRLDKIVLQLEHDIYTEEHLTLKDIQVINTKLDHVIEHQKIDSETLTKTLEQKKILIEEDLEIKPKKKRINFLMIFALLILLLSLLLHFVMSKPVINVFDSKYIVYELSDMEPSIPMNSLLKIEQKQDPVVDDLVVYENRFDQLRIKQYQESKEDVLVLINKNNNFKSEEEVNKEKVVGVVSKFYPTQGKIIHALNSSILLMYALSVILFILGVALRKEDN